MIYRITVLAAAIALGSACSDQQSETQKREQADRYFRTTNTVIPASDKIIDFPPAPESASSQLASNPDRNAYFGDLHVHTTLSFDASSFGTTATPADAYRYAQGETIVHPGGFEVKLAQALDFYAVTDHAIMLGLINEAADTSTEFSRLALSQDYHNINDSLDSGLLELAKRNNIFNNFFTSVIAGLLDGTVEDKTINKVSQSAWIKTVAAANDAYKPGQFTTFAAYEYTSSDADRGNLHRNVIFRGTDRLPAVPFSRLNSINPEGLWDWMDGLRQQGIESLAIPHNSNGSNGAMFPLTDWAGNSIDLSYANQRMRNEPLVEITQIKGTSDTHPLLSKNDEWANFEILPMRIATTLPSDAPGSYVRDGWQRGLAMAEKQQANPYQFGVIGSSDTHTGAAPLEEDNYFGKIGLMDFTPESRGTVPASFLYGTMVSLGASDMIDHVDGKKYVDFQGYKYWGASGIAGVWAEQNTRESIYDALRRKETFATTGTRITLRFFAGYELGDAQLDSPELISRAYQTGISMGGQLPASGDRAPSFLTWAVADPNTARLQRVQIIKGWVENGEHQEQVYDVACSDGLAVDPQTHRCPDNGARVNLQDCSITAGVGANELKTLWQDPDFTPGQAAFYYVRVLENPVCRWSTWDAIRSGVAPRSDLPATIQERAWSSPIWYNAAAANGVMADTK
ncbi:DUF3604 domain-containing protein [Oceanicoccus sagamiensis]|uniref:DUF3604 domain-containing protein n=1 Tax=Oceanicoccus sagamiensis TaxID=716816 RepID=A0A1X9N4Q9_9GAMM|nr:DUF3604 domain-containing protein [Oceanicoccus sagamiensis]ARN72726.1 hypothetical protein BST96_00500 [Oceanicoccus sagamiensis]